MEADVLRSIGALVNYASHESPFRTVYGGSTEVSVIQVPVTSMLQPTSPALKPIHLLQRHQSAHLTLCNRIPRAKQLANAADLHTFEDDDQPIRCCARAPMVPHEHRTQTL